MVPCMGLFVPGLALSLSLSVILLLFSVQRNDLDLQIRDEVNKTVKDMAEVVENNPASSGCRSGFMTYCIACCVTLE